MNVIPGGVELDYSVTEMPPSTATPGLPNQANAPIANTTLTTPTSTTTQMQQMSTVMSTDHEPVDVQPLGPSVEPVLTGILSSAHSAANESAIPVPNDQLSTPWPITPLPNTTAPTTRFIDVIPLKTTRITTQTTTTRTTTATTSVLQVEDQDSVKQSSEESNLTTRVTPIDPSVTNPPTTTTYVVNTPTPSEHMAGKSTALFLCCQLFCHTNIHMNVSHSLGNMA